MASNLIGRARLSGQLQQQLPLQVLLRYVGGPSLDSRIPLRPESLRPNKKGEL